ncbi:hypothetical protein GCM10009122_17620 [Fulvivirga kasyanovii]
MYLVKKIGLTGIICLSLFVHPLAAQNAELGAGLGFGTQIKAVSYNFRAFYALKNGIKIGPEILFSFKNNGSDEFMDYALSRKEYSIQAKYELNTLDLANHTTFYPIIGLSLINLKFSGESNFSDNPLFEVDDERDLFIGAYGGLGGVYELSKTLMLFGEIRYHISKEPQTLIAVGIIYPLNLPF